MKPDKLEAFIKENREEFDDQIPSLKVWAEIDQTIANQAPPKLRTSWRRRLSIAASVLVLLVAGTIIGREIGNRQQQSLEEAIAEVAPDFTEIESFYQNEFNKKYQQLVAYKPTVSIEDDFKAIDDLLHELKLELLEAPKGSEELILKSLIDSYQAKIQILERVLKVIEQQSPNRSKNKEDEIHSI